MGYVYNSTHVYLWTHTRVYVCMTRSGTRVSASLSSLFKGGDLGSFRLLLFRLSCPMVYAPFCLSHACLRLSICDNSMSLCMYV